MEDKPIFASNSTGPKLCSSIPTTVVRIKRRIGLDTPDSISVSSKRKCLEKSSHSQTLDTSTTILTKLSTVKEDEHLGFHLKKVLESVETKLSQKLRTSYKVGFQQTTKEEARNKVKSEKEITKFKFICSKRKIDLSDENDKLNIHLFDAVTEDESSILETTGISKEDVITCNGQPMQCTKNEYVYDLYYTSIPVEHSSWIENICEVQTFSSNEFEDEEENQKSDSDDENDEDNWRNDYPEEDEEETIYDDEDDYLCSQLQKANIDDSYDEEDYDEDGDFDEDGNLISYGCQNPFNSLKLLVRKNEEEKKSESSDNDELNNF